jgi:hypothetical protein
LRVRRMVGAIDYRQHKQPAHQVSDVQSARAQTRDWFTISKE